MIVIGRIVLHKQRNQQNLSNENTSGSDSAATVEAITKLQVTDAVKSVTTIAEESNENSSEDIDLTTPITIPSISSRNNVRLKIIIYAVAMCVCLFSHQNNILIRKWIFFSFLSFSVSFFS